MQTRILATRSSPLAPMNETQEWFNAGVAALRAGNKAEAETLLLRVVTADDKHEQAWLWLSGAVQTDEDRRVCLENVLALNPDNVAARHGLEKVVAQLDAAEAIAPEADFDFEADGGDELNEDGPAINLAAALLYPDDPRRKKHKHEAVAPEETPISSFISTSTFDDVWSQDIEMCAYCAHEIDVDDEKCPHCGHTLNVKHFRYEISHNLHSFWVLLLGSGQLFLVQALLGISQDGVNAAVVINFILMGVYMVLTIAVYQRQVWAHYGAIYLTAGILALVGINRLVFSTFSFIPDMGLADGKIFFQHIALTGIQTAFYFMLLGALGLALVFALFFVAADFVRDEKRQTAVLQPGINAADRYDSVAVKHAQEGRWATAVLHWQRAAAKEPNTFTYQRRLATGYARLGYYERSLSIINGAMATSSNPEVISKLKKMKTAVEQQQVTSNKLQLTQ